LIFTPFGTALDTENYGKLQGSFFGKNVSDIAENARPIQDVEEMMENMVI